MNIILIAEAGVNHNGDFSRAKKMIDVAAASGVDIVKFQTAVPELVMTRTATKANYQKNTSGEHETQLEMAKRIHLPLTAYKDLKHYCDKKNIIFLSTPFDLVSVDVLKPLNSIYYKIPSGEITNLPYLEKIGRLKRKIILSTGMSNLDEIGSALHILENAGTQRENVTVLHCNTEYPTPLEDVNLRAMLTIGNTFKVNVGYSDHTIGFETSIAAVALGATMIEKHFTLDKRLPGPDHKASLEPDELLEWVKLVRNTEVLLGDSRKKVSKSEEKNITVARKSIVAKQTIVKGEKFSEENLTIKRPGNGVSPMLWNSVMGKIARKKYSIDDLIEI